MTSPGFPPTTAVVVRGPDEYGLEPAEVTAPAGGEVLVAVAAAGMCGSDAELFAGRRPEAFVRYPVTPGHEWAGSVAAVGEDVAGLTPGDPIVAEGFRACGTCTRCREGATNLCLRGYAETGFTHAGAFSGYVTVPARLVHRLPPDADLEQAALLEPAACVAAALQPSLPTPGDACTVVGAGTLGLIAVQILAHCSPAELTLVDDRMERLDLGAALGATRCVRSEEAARLDTPGHADLVFEAAGRPDSAGLAVRSVRRGGTAVLAGISGEAPAMVDPNYLTLHQVSVRGVFGASADAWSHAVRLFSAGMLDLAVLVSHRFALTAIEDALAALTDPSGKVGKVLLLPEESRSTALPHAE